MNPTYPSVWLSANQLGYGYTALSTTNYYGVSTTIVNSTTLSVNFYQAYDIGTGHTWGSIYTWYWRVRKRSVGNTAEQPPVIRCEYYMGTNSTVTTSGAVINFDTFYEDTHTCVSNPASAWKFTTPVSGVFSAEVTVGLTSPTFTAIGQYINIHLYKNGTFYTTIASFTAAVGFNATSVFILTGTKTLRLKPGDYIQAFLSYTLGTVSTYPTGVTTIGSPRITIERLGA
jgi:hypothetical protein